LDIRIRNFNQIFQKQIKFQIGDLADDNVMFKIFEEFLPETVIHYAEQPSAPYSMRGFEEANFTFNNNMKVTFNCIWAMIKYVPDAHLIKLGTMGEYGTPNIDIEEGWINISHNGREDKFLFPRAASSLYHTTKVLDTDLLWFYTRAYGLRVTDLMQGPVYGIFTAEVEKNETLASGFHYDDIFGTVVNRFVVQAVAGVPLTVYGAGGQTRGYLNINDTLNCVRIASENPSEEGELKIYNQITETFSVNEIAQKIKKIGLKIGLEVTLKSIENPRKEAENHYYNPRYTGLKSLGLEPSYLTDEVLVKMIDFVLRHKHKIDASKIQPRVKWNK